MKIITNNFKNNITSIGRQFNDKITYTLGNEVIQLTQENIFSVSLRYESKLLGCTMKQLEINIDRDIPQGTVIKYEIGLLVNGNYEYLDMGNYIVKEPAENQVDLNSYKIICYDKMLLSMVDYTNLNINFPITIKNYLIEICNFLNIPFYNQNATFANYNKMLTSDPFLNEDKESTGYKFRDVLDDLAEVTASNICINNNDELEVRYVNYTNDIINEEFLKDTNINFEKKYGPINSIVLSRAANSDNVYLQNDESIAQNGLCELRIEDNQIMNFNNRAEYLNDILSTLLNLEYYIFDVESTGVLYYELYDMYNISIDNVNYPCLMLNDEILRTQGLQENIYVNDIENTNTDYSKADKTDIRINQTYIIANKQQGEIEALTSRVITVEDKSNNTYTIEQVNQLVQNAETGITNTFSEAGGNNILRNTGLWFANTESDAEQNPFEFWTGKVAKVKEENASNLAGMLLQNATFYQEQNVSNGKYTLTFNYIKLFELANVKVIINDVEYELTEIETEQFSETFDVSSKYIKVQFVSDTNNSCEVYDLMLNAGEISLAYSQNQNETTTDTVNISKGITITSTNTDTQFKANADGIRTLDRNGTELTKFTDTGMTTKKMIVEDTSQIVGLLIQEVNGQTWITRL